MKTIDKVILRITLLIAIMVVFGCASKARKTIDLVWPSPPETPRIKYIDMIRTNKDVEKEGSIVTRALLGEENIIGLVKPYGIAVKRGRIFVSDLSNIKVFDTVNQRFYMIGFTSGTGKLKGPIGIAASEDGRLFVSDTENDKIIVFDQQGKVLSAIGKAGEFANPSGILIDEGRKRLYIVDTKNHVIKIYSTDRYELLKTLGSKGKDEGQFNLPTNIASDSEGNIYVVDTANHRVQKFDPDGRFVLSFGALGDTPGTFVRPKGIAVDSQDHVYVVDAAFQNVQIFTKDGKLLMWFGEGGPSPGSFLIPSDIDIDINDRIYVVDQLNRRIQIFQYLSAEGAGKTEVQGEGEEKTEVEIEDEARQ